MNSPMSHPFKKFEGINVSTNITHGSIDEAADEELKGIHNSTNGDENESPYSSGPLLVEGRTSICDEIMKFDSSPSPFCAESKWSDTTSYVAKKKLHSWFQLPDGNWELAKILSTSGVESLISLPDGKVSKVNSESLLPANPDILDGVDDLMQLSYLNEPSVLNNLHYRYNCDMVYTKAGPVLVAINPFKEVPLYGNDYIEAYKHKSIESPHVYAITDTAMRQMIRDKVNQSIVISGESGAGKTETAKISMQYLAALGGGSGIEYEILKTNPILEAFGNAKTSKNDNSSRFSRVVQCAEGERSYHIFYQLCAGAPPNLREKLNIKSATEYKYLRQSNCYSISGVDDAEEFCVLMEALDAVHVSKEDQESVFAMLAAVLWLGNISFFVVDNENHVEAVPDEVHYLGTVFALNSSFVHVITVLFRLFITIKSSPISQCFKRHSRQGVGKTLRGLTSVAKLIGCNVEELKLALSSRKLRVGNDTIVQKLILSQAIDTRDALAKSIYSSLFDWLVEQINKSLAIGKCRTGRSISILDIYGFESFDEYILDGIDWANVDFEDNQDCLNLFEKAYEESTFPNGTDLTFANKLKQHLNHNSSFKGERGEAFTVCHYAGNVMYETTGFLEKNRDLLHLNTIQLLASCTCRLPQTFASTMLSQTEKPVVGSLYKSGGADSQRLSVVLKFKGQLFKLMQRLENTTPHFIRCIKPNNSQSPGVYQQGLVLHQLRCCGVLEVVRISKSGFPTRMSHQKFARRYGFLLLDNVASQDPLSVSVAILHQFNIPPEMYQVGYTKLFFRTGQIGVLEDTTNRTLLGILRVQSCFRGHKARRYLKELRRGIATLQSLVRGEKTRKEYEVLLQRHRAALLIQKEMKSSICRKKFKNVYHASIIIQSVIRGWLVRRCAGDVELLHCRAKEDNNPHEVPVDQSILAELQRRILKAEAASREKEEENDIIRQQIQHYDNRWSEYELKMKSMEETWQKQMRSLQSSLSISKKSMSLESSKRNSNASVNTKDDRYSINGVVRPMSAGLSVINRLAEEFEQRRQVFRDDAKFLVEVKSGEVEASLDPERELRWLKQMFEDWKKDYGTRLRETKLILHKLGDEGGSGDKVKNKWWGSRNSSRMIN
ncbi:hypothetical protein LguiA_000860 [Lonicera macranthoides]